MQRFPKFIGAATEWAFLALNPIHNALKQNICHRPKTSWCSPSWILKVSAACINYLVDKIVQQSFKHGFSETDIIVDLTGGKKTASIALALYTLHWNIRCQYVQTDGHKKVLQYDMAFQPAARE